MCDLTDLPSTEPMLLHVPIPSRPSLTVVSFIHPFRHHLRSTLLSLCFHRGVPSMVDLVRPETY